MFRGVMVFGLVAATLTSGGAARAQTAGEAVPANLAAPAGNVMVMQVPARGVQIYTCRARVDDPSAFEWAFVAPEAELLNGRGELIGRHYAGPTWEGNDGSRVMGEAREAANAPNPTAIPWLLLQARATEGAGAFSTVTYIQRLDTVGGRAPATGCSATQAGQELRVDYTALYEFYYPGVPAPR
jgi:hypothetical protein